MARQSDQKQKLLYVRDILLETDAEQPVTVEELRIALKRQGIEAERKSIYNDIETLTEHGIDIIRERRGKQTYYYVGARLFELAELKTLVDSVQAAKFLSTKKSMQLIKKLASLSSRHERTLLNRQVYVQNRIKSSNEGIFYNVDAIHTAIGRDRTISFRYWRYEMGAKRTYRRNGERYRVSPYALVWDDENYYMIAYDADAALLKHYRVDKMENITVEETERSGKDVFAAVDMSLYTRRNFSMFTGEEAEVTLRVRSDFVGVLLDRFGTGIPMEKQSDEYLLARVRVAVSPQFYGWICSLNGGISILSPDFVRDGLNELLERVRFAQTQS